MALLSTGLLTGNRSFAAQGPAPSNVSASTQTGAEQVGASAIQGRLLLVLPFDDRADQPNLDWIGDAVPEVLNRRLASAGFMPIRRDDRLYALEHLGLPDSFRPSRASVIRLAQTLDADYVVVGSFSTTGKRFSATAQILDMNTLHMSQPIEEQADISRLLDVLNSLAWRVTRTLDPQFSVAQQTFVAADSDLKLAAFEHYVRGLVESGIDAQIAHLKEAVRLDPSFSPALLALGKAYFANQQYDLAATTLGRLPTDDPNAREADFYRGLAYLYVGNYVKSEDAFAFVSKQLPLPEVVNNQGVAASRRGKDATALFLQAVTADPSDPDYQFNLAVALSRKGDVPGALRAIEQSLRLRPQDAEATSFEASLRVRPRSHPTDQTPGRSDQKDQKNDPPNRPGTRIDAALDPGADSGDSNGSTPLERVKRTFNEASFRQAAFEMEGLEAERLASLPPGKHAAILTEEGMHFLDRGLILEAEREFQSALRTDSNDAGAHAGLAMVREKGGDAEAARQEAERSLQLRPNASAYLVLARLDFAENQMPAAAENLNRALRLEPQNLAARGLRQQLEARGQQLP